MITTINNSHRTFLLVGDMNTSLICNIEDFERCFLSFDDRDAVKISHKWDNRFVKCSRKSVIDMLKALNLNYKFL